MKSEEEIIYEATFETIKLTRRLLWIVSSTICIGFFFLYIWYGSWDNARITARRAVAHEIKEINKLNNYLYDRSTDSSLIIAMLNEAQAIETEKNKEKYSMPLIGLNITVSDFSVGLLMIAAVVMTWLFFYQKRLSSCLKELENRMGWEVTISLLRYHFVLIGSQATKYMKIVANALFFSLPILAICFLCSDILDLYLNVYSNPIRMLALSDGYYLAYISFRLIWQLIITIWVSYMGYRCKKEYILMEDTITRFLQKEIEIQ